MFFRSLGCFKFLSLPLACVQSLYFVYFMACMKLWANDSIPLSTFLPLLRWISLQIFCAVVLIYQFTSESFICIEYIGTWNWCIPIRLKNFLSVFRFGLFIQFCKLFLSHLSLMFHDATKLKRIKQNKKHKNCEGWPFTTQLVRFHCQFGPALAAPVYCSECLFRFDVCVLTGFIGVITPKILVSFTLNETLFFLFYFHTNAHFQISQNKLFHMEFFRQLLTAFPVDYLKRK